jgi:hypothetical protein
MSFGHTCVLRVNVPELCWKYARGKSGKEYTTVSRPKAGCVAAAKVTFVPWLVIRPAPAREPQIFWIYVPS